MKTIEEKQSRLVSFMQAYLLSLGALNQIMGIFLKKSDGIMIMNMAPIAALIALHFFISDKKRDLNMNKRALLFVYYIVSIIVVYKYAFRHTTFTYSYALVYCFIPIYLSFYKVNVEKILKYMVFISALVLPVSNEFFKDVGGGFETIGMSTTYNVLPFVVAAWLHYWYYRKNSGILMWIGYGINIYYLFQVIIYGNRGPMISLIVFAIFLLLHKFNDDGKMKKNAVKKMVISILIGTGVVLILNNLEDIIISLHKWLLSMDIEISALTKSVSQIRKGDLSNGRDAVFEFAVEGIKSNFFIGNGIATTFYNSFYTIAYPHNLFLQLWYDLGVIVPLPMFYLIGKATKKTLLDSSLKKDCAVMLMLLYTLSIPRLCYSFEFWTDIPFWLLIMYTISPNLYGMETAIINEKIEERKGDDLL